MFVCGKMQDFSIPKLGCAGAQVRFARTKAERPNHPSRGGGGGVSQPGGVLHANSDMTPLGFPLCHVQLWGGGVSQPGGATTTMTMTMTMQM